MTFTWIMPYPHLLYIGANVTFILGVTTVDIFPI